MNSAFLKYHNEQFLKVYEDKKDINFACYKYKSLFVSLIMQLAYSMLHHLLTPKTGQDLQHKRQRILLWRGKLNADILIELIYSSYIYAYPQSWTRAFIWPVKHNFLSD